MTSYLGTLVFQRYYFENINCSISVLEKTVNISRQGLKKIITDSVEEGWLETKINKKNKRQILISPTNLRIKFWLLYCKSKYEKSKISGLTDANKALQHYDKNIKLFNKASKKLK